MRQFYHKQVSSRKVIVSDCDNTLWKGVCSEEQVSEIKICSPQEELQKRLIQQAENGRLVCLCSKNNEGDVLRLFTDHPGMLLRREHLCRWQINWGDKAQNIRILSEEIGLSLESFIFIDDDPVECARVSQSHPEILVLNLPADDSKWLGFLNSIWDLDIVSSTIEDKQRTEYYNTSRKRLRSNEGCVSMEDFLRSLNLRIEIALMSAVDIPRAAQLTERTNQFNLNGGRIAIAALTDMCKSEREKAFVVRVTDRFGDYGFVGFFIVETSPERLVVSTFVLSCRAIGKRVEYHMATRIAVDAMERGYDEVHFRFKKTNKNHLIEEFLSTLPVGHRGARNAFDPNCLLESCRRLLLHDVTL
jgi:FkbH-like protein